MIQSARKSHLNQVQASFALQATEFESPKMSFSKQDYLAHTIQNISPHGTELVLEAAAGTCACGRSLAPFVSSVICLDATAPTLQVGKIAAKKDSLHNMEFVQGIVEGIPYQNNTFDIVLTRLAFHHFTEMEAPFREMHRVLKSGGKFVIIDMEAADVQLRSMEDKIETMRDPSHIKNRSRAEFEALFGQYGYRLQMCESTAIPVKLSAWMELTQTPADIQADIVGLMESEIAGGRKTGYQPYLKDGGIYFDQRWLFMMGVKEC